MHDTLITGSVLSVVNISLAVVFGWPLASRLAQTQTTKRRHRVGVWRAVLLGVYVLECIAFSASMATNVLGVFLAVVWGALLGRSLSGRGLGDVVRLSLRVSLYTCLPAVSFLSILPVLAVAGWSILSTDAGRRFGIPAFFPWPINTLLGFFVAVAVIAVVFKTAATTGIAILTSQRRSAKRTEPSREVLASREGDVREE